ncbi:ABC transporter permease [Rhizobium sp. 1AS11]|uniref:ABC transporter permease n=1 Tax=Rhizobium acaciae TaxID=2989736 RepID=UPI0022220E52|nr:ABC transporter permease [Rhizobium acaciae]MCW1411295.1 ABC transporter permease [Rhizobium acaciae]MCW1743293.1 ABC transporter permease [Rhizobium acaciae]
MADVAQSNSDLARPSATSGVVPFRGGGFETRDSKRGPLSWVGLLGLLVVWQTASHFGWISSTFLPGPLTIAATLYELAKSGSLLRDISASAVRIVIGWSCGTLAGLVFGVSIALFPSMRAIGKPLITALYPIPKIAILPLLILWLGVGELPKVFTIGIGVFFPTAIATFSSIDNVQRNIIRMAQSFGVPMRSIIRDVLLPGALPGIVAGMRITTAYSLTLVVAAEMIASDQGIGSFIILAGTLMRSDQLVSGVVVLSILGLLIGRGLTALEDAWFKWR